MKLTTITNSFLTASVVLSFIPIVGLAAFAMLFVAFILSIVCISKEEKGGVRMLVSCILAVPLMVLINVGVMMAIGS